jgi:2-polyprenyl-6-methoxyphenol hydroxylase-like FAD-dependent oxidoreductase
MNHHTESAPPQIGRTVSHYHTTVIGASVSGSLAASLIGRSGNKVHILDPQPFPRKKACGEGLSLIGQKLLERLGLWEDSLKDASSPFYGYTLYSAGRGQKIELSSGQQDWRGNPRQPEGYGIPREVLDSHLLHYATSLPSVEKQDLQVSEVRKVHGRWHLRTQSGARFSSDHLIMACGSSTAMKLLPDLQHREQGRTRKRFGIACWAEGEWRESPTSVHIHNTAEGQYIITPLSETQCNFSMLLNTEYAKWLSRGEILEKMRGFAEDSGFFTSSLSEHKGAGAIHSSQTDFPESSDPLEVFLIGDTIERFDPVGGMGMAHALSSALHAAEAIMAPTLSSEEQRVLSYRKQREKSARLFRIITSLSYALNVEQRWGLTLMTRLSPRFAHAGMKILKRPLLSPPRRDVSQDIALSLSPTPKECPL